ncbi:hypothetical protein Tco_0727827 [Tanacetum coccineum]|uniref:Uncharacterized protein n=1 Tax=Tanacetum coccineum TaxID=301880 RepID=A0ABQ4YKG6_9ASTR
MKSTPSNNERRRNLEIVEGHLRGESGEEGDRYGAFILRRCQSQKKNPDSIESTSFTSCLETPNWVVPGSGGSYCSDGANPIKESYNEWPWQDPEDLGEDAPQWIWELLTQLFQLTIHVFLEGPEVRDPKILGPAKKKYYWGMPSRQS